MTGPEEPLIDPTLLTLADRMGIPADSPYLAAARPALRLRRTTPAEAVAQLGGRPRLPPGVPWPTFDRAAYLEADLAYHLATKSPEHLLKFADLYERQRQEAERARTAGPVPMTFLASFELGRLPDPARFLLPTSGQLLLFYDLTETPWGYAPWDRLGHRLLHVPDSADLPLAAWPEGLKPDGRLTACPCAALPTWTFQELEEGRDGWPGGPPPPLPAAAFDALREVDPGPLHQIGGTADAVQGPEMAMECELVRRGHYLGSGWPTVDEAVVGARAWRLVLQIDSDPDGEWMWGDGGRIYVWMREQDLRAGAWDESRLILQCG